MRSSIGNDGGYVTECRPTRAFSDGNGRTARLLMNLMLLRGGYPPIAVRPVDRSAYLDAIEHAQLGGSLDAFRDLMHTRLDATLDEYLAVLHEALPPPA